MNPHLYMWTYIHTCLHATHTHKKVKTALASKPNNSSSTVEGKSTLLQMSFELHLRWNLLCSQNELNFWSSCLHPPSVKITVAKFIQCQKLYSTGTSPAQAALALTMSSVGWHPTPPTLLLQPLKSCTTSIYHTQQLLCCKLPVVMTVITFPLSSWRSVRCKSCAILLLPRSLKVHFGQQSSRDRCWTSPHILTEQELQTGKWLDKVILLRANRKLSPATPHPPVTCPLQGPSVPTSLTLWL